MKTKFAMIPMTLLATGLFFIACNNDDEPTPEMEAKNIVEVAQEAGAFNILIEAAQKAGLATFLSTENNLTVFAPTDAAFTTLLGDLGLSSLDEIPAAALTRILSYHVIGSKAKSDDLTQGYYPTLAKFDGNNISMYIKLNNGVSD